MSTTVGTVEDKDMMKRTKSIRGKPSKQLAFSFIQSLFSVNGRLSTVALSIILIIIDAAFI